MLHPVRQLLGLWRLAHRRLLHEPALAAALLTGWLVAVALISAIPMYTDAINQALLRRELQIVQTGRRPSFAFLFHYTPASRQDANTTWDSYLALDQYLQGALSADLGLPMRTRMHYVKSDLFQLFPSVGSSYQRGEKPLCHASLGFIADSDPHIALVEGQMPNAAWELNQPLEVLVSQHLATKLGLQVGETYVLFDPTSISPAGTGSPFTLPVKIAGVWQARDPDAPFWYIPPESFDNVLLVSRETYISLVGGYIPRPLFDLGWYRVFDGNSIRAENVNAFLRRVGVVETRIASLLPGARLSLSPISALR
ncbi:MAG: hypothetical protein J7M34_01540 [Anaerolineae bacterium]|nr:hypothetical protein [Anaerolineae bacterium]